MARNKSICALLWVMALAADAVGADGSTAAEGVASRDRQENRNAVCLWDAQPAANWNEALPLRNGRIGAMVFGGVQQDRLQFNEENYWTGGPYDSVRIGAQKHLQDVRALLFENRLVEGHLLFGRQFLASPVEQQKYQCMGNGMTYDVDMN